MTAETKPTVRVTADEWTLVSSAAIHYLQVASGECGLVYSAAQPAVAVEVGSFGHMLKKGDPMMNTTGGTAWARASHISGSAYISVTEG